VQEPPLPWQPGTSQATSCCYDTVTCFSTSKWVHLHYGDRGLRLLFERVYACLRAGGLFILEPQPWSSYRKNAGVTADTLRNYAALQIRPADFEALLLDQVGFKSCEQLQKVHAHNESAGFKRRPLLLLTK